MSDQGRSQADPRFEGYRGQALELLEKFRAQVGQRISVTTLDGFQMAGLLIPRYEHADSDHVVLKLKSGYNIGIRVQSIRSLEAMEGDSSGKSQIDRDTFVRPAMSTGKKVLLLSTGGTIASRIDYRTGAVHPVLSAEDLRVTVPELEDIAEVEPEVVFSAYSENLGPTHWQILSEKIVERLKRKAINGTVVMLGTDTLAYLSAALSFALIGLGQPVICVGSQRSSDRPSADSVLNLKAAVNVAANFGQPGVYVVMHANENDNEIAVHLGTRARKNHTSRRDAFRSIDSELVGVVRGSNISVNQGLNIEKNDQLLASVILKTRFEKDVSLVKFHPGFESGVLEFLVREKGVKGIILEGTGLGHVSSGTVSKIAELTKNGVFIGITSQCIWGHVNLNVYDTGRDLIRSNVIPLGNMLPETAFAKLSWALANFPSDSIIEVMTSNLVGELNSRLSLG